MIYIANTLHLPDPNASGLLKDGRPKTPENFPLWDTLVSLLNHEQTEVTATVRIWGEQDGSPVTWPATGLPHHDLILKPDSSFAMTFIPQNPLPNPPANFRGHMTIDTMMNTPSGPAPANVSCWAMASGGNWDSRAPSVEIPVRRILSELNRWVFPYVVPVFEDLNHAGPEAYETGISIQNFSDFPVDVSIKYTVGQTYSSHGQNWAFSDHVPANGGLRFSLMEKLGPAGYNPTDPEGTPQFNTEGHLEITSSPAARLFPHVIIATKNYLFSAGQSFAE
jgi:hypothetical protein